MIRILTVVALTILAATAFGGEIHQAAETGDLATIQRLVNEDPTLLNAGNEDGDTPFLLACQEGRLDAARWLQQQGADIKAVNANGSSALNLAAYNGHVEVIDWLLESGLEINHASTGGFTPLMHASYTGQVEAARRLIQAGADMSICEPRYGGTAFHWACNREQIDILDLLYKNGFDLQMQSPVDSSYPITWAAFAGKIEALKWLIAAGADPGIRETSGRTALHLTTGRGFVEATLFLLDAGVEVDAVDNEGLTPFLMACWLGSPELAKLLAEHGADINHCGADSMSALHYSLLADDTATTRYLLQNGVNVNVMDRWKTTPLMRAVIDEPVEVLAMLMEAGASPAPVNSDGHTVLHTAVINGRRDAIGLLLEHGAPIGLQDSAWGRSELHWAALKGNSEVAHSLLQADYPLEIVDQRGRTAADLAVQYGHPAVAEILSAAGSAPSAENPVSVRERLTGVLGPGQALVWYLGHCGYAVKTPGQVMIFDYWRDDGVDDEPSLANGHINPEELKDQKVYVFVTHEHRDHFDSAIYAWKDQIPDITYVFGFRPEEAALPGQPQQQQPAYSGPAYEYIGPRQSRDIGDLKIRTVEANDAGVGFLVETDGLRILHAGDHAGWAEGEQAGFEAEIDWLAEQAEPVDMAFLNTTGCHTHDTLALQLSIQYTLEHLNVTNWFPTHGINREEVYRSFADKMEQAGAPGEAHCPEAPGDCFEISRRNRL